MADGNSPSRHSQRPRLHTPLPEQWLRSSQRVMGCTMPERHTLQHWAGPTGTTWPAGESLQGGGPGA
jgi:hypothetical protein